MKTVPTPPLAAPSLTLAERILSAFRGMGAHTQKTALIVTEAWASENPAHKRPSLSLIQGGTV